MAICLPMRLRPRHDRASEGCDQAHPARAPRRSAERIRRRGAFHEHAILDAALAYAANGWPVFPAPAGLGARNAQGQRFSNGKRWGANPPTPTRSSVTSPRKGRTGRTPTSASRWAPRQGFRARCRHLRRAMESTASRRCTRSGSQPNRVPPRQDGSQPVRFAALLSQLSGRPGDPEHGRQDCRASDSTFWARAAWW